MAEHGHTHELHSGRDVATALVLLTLGGIDLALGWVLMNPTLAAEGWHNLMDALFPIVAWVTKLMTRDSRNHRVREHIPHWLGIIFCVVTIVAITVLTIFEMTKPIDISRTAARTVAILGIVGVLVNFGLSRLYRGESPTDKAMKTHLETDALISLILIPTALVAIWLDDGIARWAYIIGSGLIIACVAAKNTVTAREIAHDLRRCWQLDRSKEA